ncbi:MAG: hypothetical protein GY940_17110, partial [bacterium]|nr:hypothetical protein [bacterium]
HSANDLLRKTIEFPDGRWETAYNDINSTDFITRSFLKYVSSEDKLYFKDGTVWTFGQTATLNIGGGEQIRVVTRIENSYGHHIDVEYDGIGSPNIKSITDSMGRKVTFYVSNNKLTKISVKNATGTIVYYYYTVDEFSLGYYRLKEFNPPVLPAVTYEYETGSQPDFKLTAVNTSYGGRMEYQYEDHTFYYKHINLYTDVVKQKKIRFNSSGTLKTWIYTYPSYQNV